MYCNTCWLREKFVYPLLFFRYLATGNSFTALQFEFHIGRSTIAKIVFDTGEAIWILLKYIEMPEVTTEEWYNIAEAFENKTNFPNCLGAIDGKHVRCMRPRSSGSKFYNYKRFFQWFLWLLLTLTFDFSLSTWGRTAKKVIRLFFETVLSDQSYTRSNSISHNLSSYLAVMMTPNNLFCFLMEMKPSKCILTFCDPSLSGNLILVNEFIITDIQGLDVQWSAHLEYWRISCRFFTNRSWLHHIL